MSSPNGADDTGPYMYSSKVMSFTCRSKDHDCSLTVLHRANHIHINILENDLKDSSELSTRYVHYIQIANGDKESQDESMEDMFDWLLEGCSTQLSQLPQAEVPPNPTLDDYYNKNQYHFVLLATGDDEFKLEREVKPSSGFYGNYPRRLFGQFGSLWPSFELSDVVICADSPTEALSSPPGKVCTRNGGPYFFKHRMDKRELETYAKIKQANLNDVRISRLCGLVCDSGTIKGLLLNYIETDKYDQTLRDALKSAAPSVREHWTEQVTTTLTRLHSAGIFWGDAKSNNILIDKENNAWIIDFGDGYTEGWVDEKLAGTIEGDNQGLASIVESLRK